MDNDFRAHRDDGDNGGRTFSFKKLSFSIALTSSAAFSWSSEGPAASKDLKKISVLDQVTPAFSYCYLSAEVKDKDMLGNDRPLPDDDKDRFTLEMMSEG